MAEEKVLLSSTTNIAELINSIKNLTSTGDGVNLTKLIKQLQQINQVSSDLTKTLNATTKSVNNLSSTKDKLSDLVPIVQSIQKEMNKLLNTQNTGDLKNLDNLVNQLKAVLQVATQIGSSMKGIDLSTQIASMKEFTSIVKTTQGLFGSTAKLDVSKFIPNIDSFLENLRLLESTMTTVGKSSENIQKVSSSISSLSLAMKGIGGSLKEFEKFTEQTSKLSPTNLTALKGPINKMIALVDTLGKSFNTLDTNGVTFDNLAKGIDSMVSTYTKLIPLVEHYQSLTANLSFPIDTSSLKNVETNFNNILILLDNFQAHALSFGSMFDGLNSFNTGVQQISNTMKNLVEVSAQFNSLIQSSDKLTPTSQLVDYFKSIFASVSQVNQSLENSPLSTELPIIADKMRVLNETTSSMVAISREMNNLSLLPDQVPNLQNIQNYFQQISVMLEKLGHSTSGMELLNTQLKGITGSVSEFSKISNQMLKLTDKFGEPEKIEQMKKHMEALTTVVAEFVVKMNSMNVDSSKFKDITELLKEMSTAFKTVATAQNQFSQNQARINHGVSANVNSFNAVGNSANNASNILNLGVGNSIKGLTSMNMLIHKVAFSFQGLLALLGGKAVYNWLIGTNAQIEDLNTSLTATLKNAEMAEAAIRRMRSYAALTPFNEMEIFKSGEMLAANRMELDRWIKVSGDLASAKKVAGTQIEDVVNVLTRINAGDFGKAMIRLRQMGISLNDLREKGLKFSKNNSFLGSSDDMLGAIELIIQERYGGLTEALGQTFSGVKSTVQDLLFQIGVDLGEVPFDTFKGRLFEVRDFLNDFRSDESSIFYTMKDTIAEITDYVNKWIQGLVNVSKTLKPLISSADEILKIFIHMQLIKFGLGIVNNLSTIIANWQTLGASVIAQNNSLMAQQALLRAKIQSLTLAGDLEGANLAKQQLQNLQLTKTETLLARILALRKAGLQVLTTDTTVDGVRTLGTGTRALNQQILLNASGHRGRNIDSLGASLGETDRMAGNAVAATLGKVGMGLIIANIVGTIGAGIVNGLKKSKWKPQQSADDVGRQVDASNEEINSMRELVSSRSYALQNLKDYNLALDEHRKLSDGSASAIEQEAFIVSRLESAKGDLVRTNEQLLRISPELVSTMYDENGQLSDLTGGYELNTQAILANIDAKKLLASQEFAYQLRVSEYEKVDLEEQLRRLELSKFTAQTSNKFEASVVKASSFVDGLLGGLITSFYSDDAKAVYDTMNQNFTTITGGNGQDAKDNLVLGIDNQIQAIKKQILANDEIFKEEQEMIKGKYFNYDMDGNVQIDPETGQPALDRDRFKADKKRKQDEQTAAQRKASGAPVALLDAYANAEEVYDKLEKEWKYKINQALLDNDGDDDAPQVKALKEQMSEALNSVLLNGLDDITEIYDANTINMRTAMNQISPKLKTLMDSSASIDGVILALEQFKSTNRVTVAGLVQYADLIADVSKDLGERLPASLRGILGAYTMYTETEQTKNDLELEINNRVLENELKLLGKDKKKSSKSAYQIFSDRWNHIKDTSQLNNDLQLQRLQLQGYSTDSVMYTQKEKELNTLQAAKIGEQINELIRFISTGQFKDFDEKNKAQMDLLKLQKEQNQLLIDIKKNTANMLGEFNTPGLVKAMTLYDYRAREASGREIQIANAQFIIKLDKVETEADARKAVSLMTQQMSLSNLLKTNEYSGVARPNAYT